MNKCNAILVIVIAAGAFAASGDVDHQAMRDAEAVSYLLKIDAFLDSGKLENGTAVYDPEHDCAFWVQNGKIHVVNERAKKTAPDLPQAPATITYDAVYEATCRDELAWETRPADITGGNKLSPEEARELEEVVKATPGDIWARTRLIDYYGLPQYDDDEARKSYERHVLWLAENAPASAAIGCAELDPDLNPEAYARAAALMKGHVEKDPKNVRLLSVAAQFFTLADPAYSIDLLNKAVELQPDNPRWQDKLSHAYSMKAIRAGGADDPEAAKGALEAQEQALQKTTGDLSIRVLSDLPERALEAGDLEKAKKYANQLLEKSNTSLMDRPSAINDGNTYLGRVALREGDMAKAKEYLIASGKCGSLPDPMFGPNMDLAVELLEKGERDAVIQYLQLCGGFWVKRITDEWIGQIKSGNDLQIKAVAEDMKSGDVAMNAMMESMQPILEAQGETGAMEGLQMPPRKSSVPWLTLPMTGPLTRMLDTLYGLPLLALLGVVLAVRLGWSRQHLWVLAPLLFIYIVPLAITKSFPQFPEQVFGQSPEELQHLLSTYFGSLALLWMLSDVLARMKWWGKLPSAVVILGIGGAVGAVNYPNRYGVIMMVGTFVVVVVASFAVAALFCSKRFSHGKFTAFLFLFNVVFMLAAWPALWLTVMHKFYAMPFSAMPWSLPHALLIALVDGVGLFLLLIPFLIVTFLVPLYNQHFKRVLNLPQTAPEPSWGTLKID